MQAERWQRVERLYQDTLEREPAGRAAFLRQNCGGDETLCREVEEMLDLAQRHEGFLERPALEIALDSDGMSTNGLRLALEAAMEGKPGGSGEFRLGSGTRLGPYEIVQPAGASGQGEVYSARDTRLGRVVALKVLPAQLMEQAGIRRRFEAEAQAISRLNHPNICTLYDVGRQDDLDFLVMEYLEGQTLASRLKQGPLPYAEVLRVAIEVSGALAYAHGRGVTHRDVKPGNIMLTAFGAKLLDFGLARLGQDAESLGAVPPSADVSLSITGLVLGTPQYMAPEQIDRREVNARTDIFALGAVIFEMSTGRKAFEGATHEEIIDAIRNSEPTGFANLHPPIPAELQRAIRRCLKKSPEERWQSAADLARELQQIEREVSPRPKANARSRIRLGAAAVSVVAILAAGIWALRKTNRGAPPIEEQVLHAFTGANGDGRHPGAGLTVGKDGVLYGTTRLGGTSGKSAIFELRPPTAQQPRWTEDVLYSFRGGRDGYDALPGLVAGGNGALYGATLRGGTSGMGTVFELAPPAAPGGRWTERVLHSFSRHNGDGVEPRARLLLGKNGVLYGTTVNGGAPVEGGYGTVFELTPPVAPGRLWTEKVVYRFTGDGAYPYCDLVLGEDGAMYGTTFGGTGPGTVFKLTPPDPEGGTWTETVLHRFTGKDGDGASPVAGLLIGKNGVLYGTTQWGGISRTGIAFELKPPEIAGGSWSYAVVHRFTSHMGDGAEPIAGLAAGPNGALYGSTIKGGTWGNGTIFKLTPASSTWTETVLYSFTGHDGDGAAPECLGRLIFGKDGALYGTTEFGGFSNVGTVFRLKP